MTKYVVTARAYSRRTGQPVGKMRNETIDTEKNVLFKNARSTQDVRAHYESFWNHLNPHSAEIVNVHKIVVKGSKKQTHDLVSNVLNKF